MYITHDVYEKMISSVSDCPPESGGILGGSGQIISCVVFDSGMPNQGMRSCHYIPNTEYLNQCIEKWEERGIDFYGIFHTHFFGVDTLSEGDARYMKRIMQAMPDEKKELYFPVVVLPERKMTAYRCIREKGKIELEKDRIYLVGTL